MRANFIHIQHLLSKVVNYVSGDFAEFGVWYGTTFMPMAEVARLNDYKIHAVDSFRGMAKETPSDGGEYKQGALNVGGSKVFKHLVKPYKDTVILHEGWVPEILKSFKTDVKFSFVHLDLDQYQPTKDCLAWIWERMNYGGILVCHDYIPGRNKLATKAIMEWVEENNLQDKINIQSYSLHCWFVK